MPALVILAAGIGSRYGGLKQIDPMGPNQQIILDYSIYDALQAGFSKIIFVIRKDIESAFREFIGNRYEAHIPCTYVYQELDDLPPGFTPPSNRTKPWGTAHALWVCRSTVNEPFAVINADDFYGRSAYQMIFQFLNHLNTAKDLHRYAMVSFILQNTLSHHGSVSRGICDIDNNGQLLSVTERTKIEKSDNGIRYFDETGHWQPLTGNENVSMNFWGLAPGIFPHLERMFKGFLAENLPSPKAEFFLPSTIDEMIHQGQATVTLLSSEDQWVGVTNPEDKTQVRDHIKMLTDTGQYPEKLWG